MDKLQMAHEYFMKHGRDGSWMELDVADAWQYADAMQAEAEKRKPSGLPESLCEVDWNKAPSDAAAYIKLSVWDVGAWIDGLGFQIENAPSFGFTGTHIVERPL